MPATLVDASVVLDVLTEDDEWWEWSGTMLQRAGESGPLYINPIIYAEIACGFTRIEELEDALPRTFWRRAELPWEASFLAAHAFLKYRRAGGTRRSPLPDFFIGAHAAIAGFTLLTRDPRRYRTYFPKLQLIAP